MRWLSLLVIATGLSLNGCNSHESTKPFVVRGHAMGTSWQVTLPRGPVSTDTFELQQAITTKFEQLESQMSHWRDDSVVSRFNRTDSTSPFEITPELATVIEEAQRTAELTDGAFDITAAPLINLWGFGPSGRQKQLPTAAQIGDVLRHVDTAHLRLTESASGVFFLTKQIPNLQIDLSALAKGYAIDSIARHLNANHYDSYLIELGGELRARGTKANGDAWRVGLEQPNPHSLDRVRRTVKLRDRAIATSGGYRNFIRTSRSITNTHPHIIDPRNGHPVTHDLVSVSVIDSSAMRADAWATALFVLGPDKGYRLATKRKMAVTFVINSGAGMIERSTALFDNCVSNPRSFEDPVRSVNQALSRDREGNELSDT